jgi:hypothetical protein
MPVRNSSVRGEIGVARSHAEANVYGAAHRVHDGGESEQNAVTGGLDNATAMSGYGRVNQLAAKGTDARDCAFLINACQPAKASHVRGSSTTDGLIKPKTTSRMAQLPIEAHNLAGD